MICNFSFKRNKLVRKLASGTVLVALLTSFFAIPQTSFAAHPPQSDKNRLWVSTSYLQHPEEGVYELQYNAPTNLVFASVMDRVNREANIGYLYAFDADTLEIKERVKMPYRAFSITQDTAGKWLYVGHTQAASLRISRVSPDTKKIAVTSERLHVAPSDPKHEHLRHMVYSDKTGELFVAYVGSENKGNEKRTTYRLLILDGQTLQLKGEVENAYPSTGFGLTVDSKTQRIYTAGGDFINEIDPTTHKVVRSISLQKTQPRANNIVGLKVDSASNRIFASQFIHEANPNEPNETDGLYVFDMDTGAQKSFTPTGKGAVALAFNAKHNEIYVSNFFAGNVSVIDGKTYKVQKSIQASIFPNMLTQSTDESALYVGVKQGFSRMWNPDEFVAGAKEQIYRISLDEDEPSEKPQHP